MAVDQMHDLKAVFSMLVSVLVGNNSDSGSYGQWQGSDFKHQAESEMDGVFPEIWLDSEDPLLEKPLPWRLSLAELEIVDKRAC